MPLYNPLASSSATPGIPQVVVAGDTFQVDDGTQRRLANQIVTEETAIILTEGTGSFTWLD